MDANEIKVGNWYKAKVKHRPARFVVWISHDRTQVQIDGDEVKLGSRLPKKTMDQFLKWCRGKAKTDKDGYLVGNGWE